MGNDLPHTTGRIYIILYHFGTMTPHQLEVNTRMDNFKEVLKSGEFQRDETGEGKVRDRLVRNKLYGAMDRNFVEREEIENGKPGRNPYGYQLTDYGKRYIADFIRKIRKKNSFFAPKIDVPPKS